MRKCLIVPLHNFFCKCGFVIFLTTRNGSKYKVVRLQSSVKRYHEGRLYSTHNQFRTVCGRFTKFAVYRYLHATISQHCKHCQTSAWSIPTNTRTKPVILNTDSLTVAVGYGQIALLQRYKWKFYPIRKRDTWPSWQRFLGHRDISFKKRTAQEKNGTYGNSSLFTNFT